MKPVGVVVESTDEHFSVIVAAGFSKPTSLVCLAAVHHWLQSAAMCFESDIHRA
jgi:hypothetical protein